MKSIALIIAAIALLVIAAVGILVAVRGIDVREDTTMAQRHGVLKMTALAAAVEFKVPDEYPYGWGSGHTGNETETISLTLEETTGKGAVITRIYWTLYDAEGNFVTSGSKTVYETVGSCATVDIYINLNEGDANQIDDADKPQDNFSGSGIFIFGAEGVDSEFGEPLGGYYEGGVIPASLPMTVALP